MALMLYEFLVTLKVNEESYMKTLNLNDLTLLVEKELGLRKEEKKKDLSGEVDWELLFNPNKKRRSASGQVPAGDASVPTLSEEPTKEELLNFARFLNLDIGNCIDSMHKVCVLLSASAAAIGLVYAMALKLKVVRGDFAMMDQICRRTGIKLAALSEKFAGVNPNLANNLKNFNTNAKLVSTNLKKGMNSSELFELKKACSAI